MSQFRRRLLMMMQKVQEIWRDVVLTGTGLVVANDTTSGQPVKIFPQGWTKQNQYEGNNLWDPNSYVFGDGGVNVPDSVLIENNVLYLRKESGTVNQININFLFGKLPVGNYKISYKKLECKQKINENFEDGLLQSTSIYKNGEKISTNLTFSVDDETADYQFICSGTSKESGFVPLTEFRIYEPMLALSTISTYEPYTGGQPSPSPNYPQPILNAGTYNEETGKYEYGLEVTPKNLVNLTVENTYGGNKPTIQNIENGIEFSYSNVRDTYCVLNYQLKRGKTYYIMFDVDRNSDTILFNYAPILISNESEIWHAGNVLLTVWGRENIDINKLHFYKSFVTPTDEDCVIYISGNNNITSTGTTKIYNLCISEAEGDTFVPYQPPQSVTLTSDRPLTQWDRLVYMDGQWQWEYGGENIVFDGDENIRIYSSPKENVQTFFVPGIEGDANDNMIYSKSFLNYANVSQKDVPWITNITKGSIIYFNLPLSIADDAEKAKEYFSQNNTDFLFKASTPEYVPLPESEQQALNALRTYYPTTVFSNDQNGFMQIEYRTKYGNVIYIDDGFLEQNTSTATSEPTQSTSYPNAWSTTAIKFGINDRTECTTTANSIWQRMRLYKNDGTYYTGGGGFNYNNLYLYDSGFARLMSADGSGTIQSLKVVHEDGTETVYQVVDRRSGT